MNKDPHSLHLHLDATPVEPTLQDLLVNLETAAWRRKWSPLKQARAALEQRLGITWPKTSLRKE